MRWKPCSDPLHRFFNDESCNSWIDWARVFILRARGAPKFYLDTGPQAHKIHNFSWSHHNACAVPVYRTAVGFSRNDLQQDLLRIWRHETTCYRIRSSASSLQSCGQSLLLFCFPVLYRHISVYMMFFLNFLFSRCQAVLFDAPYFDFCIVYVLLFMAFVKICTVLRIFFIQIIRKNIRTAITVDTSARPPNAKLIAVCVCGYFVANTTPSAIALSLGRL